MRSLLVFGCIVLMGCAQVGATTLSNGTIRTEVKQFESRTAGKVRIENTFRNDERIMSVMSSSNGTARSFYLHNKLIFVEADDDRDGFFESITLPGERMEEFETFTRSRDGKVEPLSAERYAELKKKVHDAAQRLDRALHDAMAEKPQPAAGDYRLEDKAKSQR